MRVRVPDDTEKKKPEIRVRGGFGIAGYNPDTNKHFTATISVDALNEGLSAAFGKASEVDLEYVEFRKEFDERIDGELSVIEEDILYKLELAKRYCEEVGEKLKAAESCIREAKSEIVKKQTSIARVEDNVSFYLPNEIAELKHGIKEAEASLAKADSNKKRDAASKKLAELRKRLASANERLEKEEKKIARLKEEVSDLEESVLITESIKHMLDSDKVKADKLFQELKIEYEEFRNTPRVYFKKTDKGAVFTHRFFPNSPKSSIVEALNISIEIREFVSALDVELADFDLLSLAYLRRIMSCYRGKRQVQAYFELGMEYFSEVVQMLVE